MIKKLILFLSFFLIPFSYSLAQHQIDFSSTESVEGYKQNILKNFSAKKKLIDSLFQFYQNLQGEEQIQTVKFLNHYQTRGVGEEGLIEMVENLMWAKIKRSDKYSDYLKLATTISERQPSGENRILFKRLTQFFKYQLLYDTDFVKVYLLSNNGVDFSYKEKKDATAKITVLPPSKSMENPVDDDDEYDPWQQVESRKDLSKPQLVLDSLFGLIASGKGTLVLKSPSDSIAIQGAEVEYSFSAGTLHGNKGQLVWKVNKHVVKADLDTYLFVVANGKLLAENVELSAIDYLKQPIFGSLVWILEKRAVSQVPRFPIFQSYHNDAQLKFSNLSNVKYTGGFSLYGMSVSGASQDGGLVTLKVNEGEKTNFELKGLSFAFTDSLIQSEKSNFKTKFGKDSITHPAVRVVYDLKKQLLKLYKLNKSGYRQSMYSDTYHQVDIRSDAMSWDLNSGKIDFYIISGKSEVPALFESFNYFNPNRLRELSTNIGFNPLIAAGNHVARTKVNRLSLQDMQKITGKEKNIVAHGMLLSHQMGFFDFDDVTNTYSLSRKGKHYFLAAMGKSDYDDLVLSSLKKEGNTADYNASIDLETKSLDIQGAQNFKLSDSLGIKFLPKDQSMKIIGNKIFSFNGKIEIKNFKFYGDFIVEYENLIVKLNRIDSIAFTPLQLYKLGKHYEIGGHFKYGNVGTIYLNDPNNKSGRQTRPEYPKLEIPGGVSVLFNETSRKKKFDDRVNFKAETLSLDSLNTVDPRIVGVFTSGGILPTLKEQLQMMPDSSMGISHSAQTAGYNLYGSKSSFKPVESIVLDRSGIHSSGELTHLAAVLNAEKVIFDLDSLIATGKNGKVAEGSQGAYFPNVDIASFQTKWYPERDSMSVFSSEGFKLYQNSTLLKGALVLSVKGLFGSGSLLREDIDIESKDLKFDKFGFLAQQAEFKVKSKNGGTKPAFSGNYVGIKFDIPEQKVQFNSQQNNFDTDRRSQLEFPFVQYKTTIDNAIWDIKIAQIDMKGELKSSEFFSTDPNQYGLRYHGTQAHYDISIPALQISGVNEIYTVDAAVVPADGKVLVKPDGSIERFTNAKIIADTLNRYHVMTNANVQVNSKLSYTGEADYQFVNVKSDTFNIKLSNFEFAEVTPDGQILKSKGSGKLSTIARANILATDSLYLSTKMRYKGEMLMLAPFKNLTLSGQIYPELPRYPHLAGRWINYQGNKSEEISINIDETLTDGGKPMFVGLHMRSTGGVSSVIYPTFLNFKVKEDDIDLFLAKGVLKRKELEGKFEIATEGSNEVFEFHEEKGLGIFKGKVNLLGFPSKVLENAAIVNIDMDSLRYRFDNFFKLDFGLPIPLVQKIGSNIVKANLDAKNAETALPFGDEDFQAKLRQYMDKKELEKYLSVAAKGHMPLFKGANQFLTSLVLSKVELRWIPQTSTYYSVGSIGVSNLGDVDVNAMLPGYVEIIKSPATGDELHIFLDISETRWYYFIYRNGQLSLATSDDEVARMLSQPTPDGKGKEKKNAAYMLIDFTEGLRFKKNFLKVYQGLAVEDIKQTEKQQTEKSKEKKDLDGF